MSIKILQGSVPADDCRIGIVAAQFNDFIVDKLLAGALATLKQHEVAEDNIVVARVPGAFEIPVTIQRMAQSKRYDALIALGAVIRGSTPHFDYVAGECSSGLTQVSLKENIPVIFGVITTNTVDEALERAGIRVSNKGAEAATAALEMAQLFKLLPV